MNCIVKQHATVIDALRVIDANEKGFAIVSDDHNKIVATVTDGDIRRALIKGVKLTENIKEVANFDFKVINFEDNFETIVQIFKSSKIHFLPIVDNEKKIINVITKKQLHIALLEDTEWKLDLDFDKLDDQKLEQEIYNRPWGYYKTVFLNDFARAKIICVEPKGKLSLQEHKFREEHWVIINGKGQMTIGESIKQIVAGDHVFIPKGCKHTIENTSANERLFISEVQLGSYFGEDDIIRYSDIYGRV